MIEVSGGRVKICAMRAIQSSERSCVGVALGAGTSIADGAKRLGLKISPQSVVLFDRPGVAKLVAEMLKENGIDIRATDITKDLCVGGHHRSAEGGRQSSSTSG